MFNGNISNVSYHHQDKNNLPWENPYDGIMWDNENIPKPTKEELDALDEDEVYRWEINRRNTERKQYRDSQLSKDLSFLAALDIKNKLDSTKMTISEYADFLESKGHDFS